MWRAASVLPLLLAIASGVARSDEPAYRDVYPATWVATDALGRSMPEFSLVGRVKEDQRRVVGISYITWHSDAPIALHARGEHEHRHAGHRTRRHHGSRRPLLPGYGGGR